MDAYTYSEARQNLATILDRADETGGVLIRRRDGRVFALTPVTDEGSPFDIPGIKTDITRDEIVEAIRESRRA